MYVDLKSEYINIESKNVKLEFSNASYEDRKTVYVIIVLLR